MLLTTAILLAGCQTVPPFQVQAPPPQAGEVQELPTDTPEPEEMAEPTATATVDLGSASKTPEPLPRGGVTVPTDENVQRLIERATQEIAEVSSASADSLEVTAVEQVEWSDASLGCPQPNQMYAQVITPGYRIVLTTGDESFEFHSSLNPEGPLVRCDE